MNRETLPQSGEILERHECQSVIWKKIESYLEQRLSLLRAKNDGDLDEIATARLRGKIAEVKNLLTLGHPAPAVKSADDTDAIFEME